MTERGRDTASQTGLNWWHCLLSEKKEREKSGVSTDGIKAKAGRERKR